MVNALWLNVKYMCQPLKKCHMNEWHTAENVDFIEHLGLSVNYFHAVSFLTLSPPTTALWLSFHI